MCTLSVPAACPTTDSVGQSAAGPMRRSTKTTVLPFSVELAMAALNSDLFESRRPVGRTAGVVVGEHTAGELVEPVSLGLGAQLGEESAAETMTAGGRVDIHGVFADALVDAAIGVGTGPRPPDDPAGELCDDEGPAIVKPAGDVGRRA